MSNWYKYAYEGNLDSFEDRNLLNEKIEFFESAMERLEKLSKVIFQDPTMALKLNQSIANDVKLSSHPGIRETLLAANQIVFDSPWKFAELLTIAREQISMKLGELELKREEFTQETKPKLMKGWVDKHV